MSSNSPTKRTKSAGFTTPAQRGSGALTAWDLKCIYPEILSGPDFLRINEIILFIVYTAFCESVEGTIWEHYGIGLTVRVLLGVIALFATVSFLVWAASNVARLERDDFITALFCSVKKTLAMGVPLAQLIFGAKANLGLILLPIMFYHPFQLFVCGLLANRCSNQNREIPLSKTAAIGQA
jgi:predicted Na+-dependent transporter